jgi:hypothetical protein
MPGEGARPGRRGLPAMHAQAFPPDAVGSAKLADALDVSAVDPTAVAPDGGAAMARGPAPGMGWFVMGSRRGLPHPAWRAAG